MKNTIEYYDDSAEKWAEEWYNNEENYIINFTTENEEQKYKVFSVYKIKNEDYYIDTEFKKNEFEKFANGTMDTTTGEVTFSINENNK